MCSYANKSHDQNYRITLCILINVIQTLELKTITINGTHHYIKRQHSEQQVQQFFRVPEVLHNICNMCGRDFPDMSTLALRCWAPRVCGYISGKFLLPMLHIQHLNAYLLWLQLCTCFPIKQIHDNMYDVYLYFQNSWWNQKSIVNVQVELIKSSYLPGPSSLVKKCTSDQESLSKYQLS